MISETENIMLYPHERRDFERIKVNTAMSLSYGKPTKVVEGLCCDLSDSGIGIEVDKVIALGTECYVDIHDGHEKKVRFQAVIEIKRIYELDNDRYRLGALILEKL